MPRYVDADKLHYKRVWVAATRKGPVNTAVVVFAGEIDALALAPQTTDVVEVKHAVWLREQVALPLSDGSKECFRCSSCLTHWDNESNYCPNCGAKMEEKTDAEIH